MDHFSFLQMCDLSRGHGVALSISIDFGDDVISESQSQMQRDDL